MRARLTCHPERRVKDLTIEALMFNRSEGSSDLCEVSPIRLHSGQAHSVCGFAAKHWMQRHVAARDDKASEEVQFGSDARATDKRLYFRGGADPAGRARGP